MKEVVCTVTVIANRGFVGLNVSQWYRKRQQKLTRPLGSDERLEIAQPSRDVWGRVSIGFQVPVFKDLTADTIGINVPVKIKFPAH